MKNYVIALGAASLMLVGCNQNVEKASAEFNQLPPDVQKTVRAHSPNGEITAVAKKEQDGQTVYHIDFVDGAASPSIIVAADGRMLQSDSTKGAPGMLDKMTTGRGAVGTQLSALPQPVQKTVQEHSPNAVIAGISSADENGLKVYTIEFKTDGENRKLRVAENGTIIENK